jgi:hypothetical protein
MIKSKIRISSRLLAVLLCCTAFSIPALAMGAPEGGELPETVMPVQELIAQPREPLSQGSSFSTRDLLYDKATNKQFITVEGRDGNIFYIIIDYDAPVGEDEEQYATYFLNQVDESDLAALLGEEEAPACICTDKCAVGAVNTACPVCAVNMSACTGKEAAPVEPEIPVEPVPEPEPENTMGGPLLILLILALNGGAVFSYIRFIKNKPKVKAPAALDDYDFYEDGDPEETELDENDGDEPEDDMESEDKSE